MKFFKRLIPPREQLLANRWLRWLGPLLHKPRLWCWSRRGVAMGVGIGIFFGLLIPIAQIPFSAAAAVLLRANLPAAVASTLVTNPVTFAPIYFAAYHLGARITGAATTSTAITPPINPFSANPPAQEPGVIDTLTRLGTPLIVGLAVTATIAGLASYALISLGWYWHVMRKRRRRIRHV